MSSVRGHGWSLQWESWRELAAVLQTAQPVWHRTVLAGSHRGEIPARPGVYAIEFASPVQLASREPHGPPTIRAPIYIGMSKTSIRDRFAKHVGDDPQDLIARARLWPQGAGTPRVFIWAVLPDPRMIVQLEARLIECFNPACNKIAGLRLSDGRPAGAP